MSSHLQARSENDLNEGKQKKIKIENYKLTNVSNKRLICSDKDLLVANLIKYFYIVK